MIAGLETEPMTDAEEKPRSALEKLRRASISNQEKLAERRAAEKSARWVMHKIALLSQATVIYAAPNTGKTLIVLWLLMEELKRGSADGLQVYYLNADDDFRGANDKAELVAGSGIEMIVPGQEGFEIDDFTKLILELVENDQAQGFVVILDTLKKFTSLMDKEQARHFGTLARKFVQAGGTLITLAHTNKHKDGDNKSVFEGTGDIVSDFDAAYTIELDTPKEDANRQVTFENFKSRGPNTLKASFGYNAGEGRTWAERFNSVRRVDERDAAATADAVLANARLKEDRPCIDYLTGKLESRGSLSRRALVQDDLGNGFSRGQRERTLDRYDESNPQPALRFWRSFGNTTGGKSYELLSR